MAVTILSFALAYLWQTSSEAADDRFAAERAPGGTTVAGIEVAEPWGDKGQIPLETGVEHRFLIRNVSPNPVTLGTPSIEVLEGC